MMEWIKKLFSWERDSYAETFEEELNFQCRRILLPASVICLFAWLSYVKVDGQLHPEEPLIISLRYGLSVTSLIVLILQFVPFFRQYSMILLTALGFYLESATGLLTALTGGDPVYMGGYLFVLMIPIVAPVKKSFLWVMIGISLGLFFSVGLYRGMSFATVRQQYSLNDLITTSLFVFVFIYILDRMRYRSWQLSRETALQRARLLEDKYRIENLIAEAKSVVSHVRNASEMLGEISQEISGAIAGQVEIFARSRDTAANIKTAFEGLAEETREQLRMNQRGRELTASLREDISRIAVAGQTASDDARKVKALSDDSGEKIQSARRVIEKLKDESSRIEEITNTINEIADQTNLLSLNASIESARAGEHGRGFAVVADEISKLAEKSISSAREIGDIIRLSVERINDASWQIQETSGSLQQIVQFLEASRGFLEEVREMSTSQDEETKVLVDHLEDSLRFAGTVEKLTLMNREEIEQSQGMLQRIEEFYNKLKDMSDILLKISERLIGQVSSLQGMFGEGAQGGEALGE